MSTKIIVMILFGIQMKTVLGCKNQQEKGERLIIINAITKSGWISGSKLVFKSTRKTGDYHGQMNWDLFKKWFTEMLLPNIPENCLIIMDNAPYHNTLSEHSPPTPLCSKKKNYAMVRAKQNSLP